MNIEMWCSICLTLCQLDIINVVLAIHVGFPVIVRLYFFFFFRFPTSLYRRKRSEIFLVRTYASFSSNKGKDDDNN